MEEAGEEAVIGMSLDYCITKWNPGAEQMYGYRAEEVLGRSISMLAPIERRRETTELIERLRRGEPVDSFETIRVCKSGEQISVHISLSRFRDPARQGPGAIVGRTERKRAEDLLPIVVEAVPNAMIVANGQGKIVLVNTQTERLFGFTRDELIGRDVDILVPLPYRGQYNEYRSQFLRQPRAQVMGGGHELWGLRKDGSEFPAEIGLSPIDTEHETWVLSAIVDIAERRHSEGMFRQVVEAAPNAMVVADGEGKIVLVNTLTEQLFGYPREELIGRDVDILVPPGSRNEHLSYRSEFMREPRTEPMARGRDLRALRKDGSEFPVEVGLNPIRTERGLWVVGAIVDASHPSSPVEIFRSAVDAAPGAMVMVDPDGKMVLVNSKAGNLFGYLREELIGRSVDMLTPPEYQERHVGFMRESQTGGLPDRQELYGFRKDGVEFPVEIGASPVKTDKGTWVLGEILDLTERKRAEMDNSRMNLDLEERVAERTAELTAAYADLESFSYSVSHDLRAPLRQISGFSKILVETYGQDLNPEARRYLQKVQDGAHHMGILIDDLLNLAKVGRQSLSRRPTPLHGLVETALEVLKPEYAGREIEWQIATLWTAECDPGLIKQVFINILSNAIKYTRIRDRGMIQVGQTTTNDELVIFVRDNGAGFDMSYAGKLFGVFQRLHHAQDFEGTGVGLAICQRIIHKHGGRIWAEAEPDKGATFFFTIPGDPESKRANGRNSGNGKLNHDNSNGQLTL